MVGLCTALGTGYGKGAMRHGTRAVDSSVVTRHWPLATVSWLPAAGSREHARKNRTVIRPPTDPCALPA
jgi:hypothetical protein